MAPVYESWETNGQRILHWVKLISITGSTQILIQAIGLIVGIMTVRLLPIKEYAWFTIANTMLGALTVLGDCGISSGVMAEGGKYWQNKERLGSVLATGMFLRKKFAFISLCISLPILSYLLVKNGANWWQIVLVILALIPSFFASLTDVLLEIPLKLHQDIGFLQKNQMYAAITRLILTICSIFLLPFTFVVLLGNGISRILANIKLKKRVNFFSSSNVELDLNAKKSIRGIVKKTLPGSIYFVFSGQINIWLISIFGNTTSIATIGAMGRITVAFSFISILSNILVVPRFAKLPDENFFLKSKFYLIVLVNLFFCVTITSLLGLFSKQVIGILGQSYFGLQYEFFLSVIAALLGILVNIVIGLSASKGWVINPTLLLMSNFGVIIFGILIFDYTSLYGILLITIFQNFILFLLQFIFCLKKINSI